MVGVASNDNITKLEKVPSREGFKWADTTTTSLIFFVPFFAKSGTVEIPPLNESFSKLAEKLRRL